MPPPPIVGHGTIGWAVTTGSMRRTRVYVVGLDRLPRSILATLLESQDDIEVVHDEGPEPAEPLRIADLLRDIDQLEPDVVLMTDCELDRLAGLHSLSGLRIIVLTARGTGSHVYQISTDSRSLGQVSPDRLLSVIRGAPLPPT